MLATVTADPLGVLIAFGAGILSFLSPCVLPLVPGYLSVVSGLSAAELAGSSDRRPVATDAPSERRDALVGAAAYAGPGPSAAAVLAPSPLTAPAPPAPVHRPLKPLLRGMLLFVAGFTVVFVVLGAAATGVHHLFAAHLHTFVEVAGGTVVVLGLVMLVSSLPAAVWMRLGPGVASRAAWLFGERRVHVRAETFGSWAAPIMGMAFAVAWTPCIGPVLGAVLTLASARATLAGGMLLLFAYSLGLGVPFVATGLAFGRLTTLFGRVRRRLALVQGIAAVVLVAFGAMLLAGNLGWLSSEFNSLLNGVGLHCSTASGCFS